MNRKVKNVLKWTLLYPLVVFVCLELAFRIMGYGAFYNEDYSVKATPANAYIGHSKLGIQLNAGTYNIVLNKKIRFTATHEDGNHRFTPGAESVLEPSVLMLGCSFTYGYGVDDDETFTAILQKKFPNESFRNNGVVGYGTVQSLMQLKEAVKSKELKVVILNFSSLHYMRNNLSQQYRSNLKIGYQRSNKKVESLMQNARFPYKESCESEIQFQDWESMYSNWPGRSWLASINGLQSIYDNAIESDDQLEITACIIREMQELCFEHDIKFLVSCLDYTEENQKLHKRIPDIDWHEVQFNFRSKKVTNLPYDSHPNTFGHEYIARELEPKLKQLLDE